MNILEGMIIEVVTEDAISLVSVEVNTYVFSSIVIDTPATNPSLKRGHPVSLLFKETEVIIARPPLSVSVQNKLPCTVQKIHTGKILCELTLHWSGQPENGPVIRSIITRNACEQLNLRVNDPVIALIKTNEVSLLIHD